MKGGRKASAWNLFTKKIFEEGRSKSSDYSFKQALKDASARKSEMSSVSGTKSNKSAKMSKTKKGGKKGKNGTRRR